MENGTFVCVNSCVHGISTAAGPDYTSCTFISPAKLARLKQAREEAEKEIAEFRAQMECEFQIKVEEAV